MSKIKGKKNIIKAVIVIIVCVVAAKMIYGVVKPDYPEDLEVYVQEYLSRLDPAVVSGDHDPEHNKFKKNLYKLKQVYPDKSYAELHEMTNDIEDASEYRALFHPDGDTNMIEGKYFIIAVVIVILVLCIIASKICKVEPNYPDDLEAYVQKVIDQTDSIVISDDPQYKKFKKALYELKQVYPDKSYEELDKMRKGWVE